MPTVEDIQDFPSRFPDIAEFCPDNEARHQGTIGSCVGWDFSFIRETQNSIINIYDAIEADVMGHVPVNFSAGWVYHFSRLHSRKPIPDNVSGSTNFGACRSLKRVGIATEAEVKTDIWKPWDGITYVDAAGVEARALERAIKSYHRIDPNPASIKAAMMGIGHEMPYKMEDGSPGITPVACAWPVYESLKTSYDDGIVSMPGANDRKRGGHSTMCIGWDVIDDEDYWVIFNSWGRKKGGDFGDIEGGIWFLPVEYPFYPNDWYLLVPNYVAPPKPDPIDPKDDPNYVGPWEVYKDCQITREAYYDTFIFTSDCTGGLQARDIEMMHRWIDQKKKQGCWFHRMFK